MFMVMSVRKETRHKTDDDILNLPMMTEPVMSAVIKLLFHVSFHCFLRKDTELLAVYSALLAVRLTLRHGLSPYSAGAFATSGITELTLGKHHQAVRFGQLSLKLLESCKCRESECPTLGLQTSMLAHWTERTHKTVEPLHRALEAGIEVGDAVYGFFCLANYIGTRLTIGDNLRTLEIFMRNAFRQTRGIGDDTMRMWCHPAFQYILNMQSKSTCWKDLVELTGEVMDERDYILQARKSHHPLLVAMVSAFKSFLAFTFGFNSWAEELCKDVHATAHVFLLTSTAPTFYTLASLVSFERYRETGRRKHIRTARKYKKPLQRAQLVGNPNVSPHIGLLNAEDVSGRKNASLANIRTAYQQATDGIDSARLGPNLLSWACQRAGFALAEKDGDLREVQHYFDTSMELTREMGSEPVYEYRREKNASVLAKLTMQSADDVTPSNMWPLVGKVIQIHEDEDRYRI
jgi:hypothetical protein